MSLHNPEVLQSEVRQTRNVSGSMLILGSALLFFMSALVILRQFLTASTRLCKP